MGVREDGPLRPRLRVVDVDAGRVVDEVAFDPDLHPNPGPAEHLELTASWREGDTLLQPTRTGVLRLSLPEGRVIESFSHPWMTDVHSACPVPGGVAVTATGIDAVLTFDADRSLRSVDWLGEPRPEAGDLRRVPFAALKPHRVHPNHACWHEDRLWVTRFEDRCCRPTSGEGRVDLPEGPPHDGCLREGLWWFTMVTGRVVGLDPRTHARVVDLDVAALTGEPGLPGWCRGVEVVGSRLFVGMTMLRGTTHREVLRRVLRGKAGRKLPTRVVEIDLDTGRRVREIPVGNALGGTIYALHALR